MTNKILDGRNYAGIKEHIDAFGAYGIYLEPRSSQWTEFLKCTKTDFMGEEPLLDQVKNLIKSELGQDLTRTAKQLARSRQTFLPDYAAELKATAEEHGWHLISADDPLLGIIEDLNADDWIDDFKIDPLCLEKDFEAVFGEQLDESSMECFRAAFSSFRESEYLEDDFYDPESGLENFDFWAEFLPDTQKPMETLNKMVREALSKPFTEFFSFHFTSDDCYPVIDKNVFFAGVGGIRDGETLELCFFKGEN
jgi:hypothetical protein